MDARLGKTLVGAIVGGISVVGLCVALTVGAANSMQQDAARMLATIDAPASSASATPSSSTASDNGSGASASDDGGVPSSSGASSDGQSGGRSDEQSGDASGSASGSSSSLASSSDTSPAPGTAVQIDKPDDGAKASGDVYIIQYGDTLSSISAMVGRSVDELAKLNQIADVNLIYAESALRIPE